MQQDDFGLITANGSQSADQQASIHIDCIDQEVQPYVLPDSPAVISVGMRCIQDGWDSVWRKFSRPYFRKKDGTKIKLELKDYVPYLPSKDGRTPAAVGVPFPRVTYVPVYLVYCSFGPFRPQKPYRRERA